MPTTYSIKLESPAMAWAVPHQCQVSAHVWLPIWIGLLVKHDMLGFAFHENFDFVSIDLGWLWEFMFNCMICSCCVFFFFDKIKNFRAIETLFDFFCVKCIIWREVSKICLKNSEKETWFENFVLFLPTWVSEVFIKNEHNKRKQNLKFCCKKTQTKFI